MFGIKLRTCLPLSSILLLPILAGCGGGSAVSPQSAVNSTTRQSQLTRFDVDVATGKVTVTPGDTSAGTRAVLANGAVSFTTTDLLNVPGDSGKRVMTLSYVNNSGEPSNYNYNSTSKVIVTGLQNKASFNLRNTTSFSPYAGDGGATDRDGYRTTAGIAAPLFITNLTNNRYAFTTGTHTVRIIGSDGTISTFAGKSGTPGFVDAGGTNARFNNPGQIASDSNGNLYIADTNNNAIRRISIAGEVTTIAGTGAAGSTDGAGNVATFRAPVGLAIAGNGARIYVSDTGNHTIRVLTYNTGNGGSGRPDLASSYAVSTIVGSAGNPGLADGDATTARFNAPSGLAILGSGNYSTDAIYLADTQNNAIRLINYTSSYYQSPTVVVYTIAGNGAVGAADGSGRAATFNKPLSISGQFTSNYSSSQGNFFVSDTSNQRIRQVILPAGGDSRSASDYQVTTLGGDGTAGTTDGDGTVARLNNPAGFALLFSANSSGYNPVLSGAYVAETGSNRIRQMKLNMSLGSNGSDNLTAEPVRLLNGQSEVPGETSAWVVGDTNGYNSGINLQFYVPQGVSGFSFTAYVETDTGIINLPAAGSSFLTTLGGDGKAGDNDGPGKLAELNSPIGITAISSRSGFSSSGGYYARAFIADTNNHRIRSLSPSGIFSTFVGSRQGFADGAATVAQFNTPSDIAYSSRDNCLYVADTGNRRIRRIALDGSVTTVAGNGSAGNTDGSGDIATLDSPRSVAVDAGGTIFVSDQARNVIRRIRASTGSPLLAATYQVTTIAGAAGQAGSTDGVGTAARFNVPCGLFCDTDGRIYVADSQNHTIRVLTRTGSDVYAVATLAGSAGGAGFADGTGASARFSSPTGVVADTAHNLYICDYGNNRIRRVSPQGTVVTLIGGPAGFVNGASGLLSGPAIATIEDSGNLLIADYRNHSVRSLQRLISSPQGQ